MADRIRRVLAFLPGDGVDHGPAAERARRHRHLREGDRLQVVDALGARRLADDHGKVAPPDLAREFGRKNMVLGRFRGRCHRAEEAPLGRPVAAARDRLGCLDQRARVEAAALDRTDFHSRRCRKGRDVPAQALGGELAVIMVGIGGSYFEIATCLGLIAGDRSSTASPVKALGARLRGARTTAIAREHADRIARAAQILQCHGARQPGQAGIIVADAEAFIRDVMALAKGIIDLGGNIERQRILAIVACGARLGEQQLVPGLCIDRTILQCRTTGEHLPRQCPVAGINQTSGALRDIARIGHRFGSQRSGKRIGIGQVLEHGEARGEHRAPRGRDIAELLLGIGRRLRPEQSIHPRIMICRREVCGKAAEQHCLVLRHHRAAAPGRNRNPARGIALTDGIQRHGIARAADIGQRWIPVEIGDDLLRRGRSCAQRLFRAAAHLVLVGPAGVGDQKAGKGREGVIVRRRRQRAPVGDGAGHVGRHGLQQIGAGSIPVAAVSTAGGGGSGKAGGLITGETGGGDANKRQGEQRGGAPRDSNS